MTPRQQLDGLIDLFTPEIRAAFLAAIQDIVDNVILSDVIAAIQAGDVEAAFAALGYSPAAMRPLTAAIERAYETGGVFTGNTFPKYIQTFSGRAVFRFDVRNSRAEAWLRDKSSTLVTRLENEARVVVRNTLTTGMQEGRNPRNVALDIIGRVDRSTGKRVGGVVGLTEGQEEWVRSARRKLIALDDAYFNMALRDKRFDRTVAKAIKEGKPLAADVVDKLVDRYKDNALKYRGEMIARTEALQSLNASEWEATKQAVALGATKTDNVKREWDSAGDSRVRFSHRKMDGQRVGIDEPFVSPSGARMMHPGDTSLGAGADEVVACRCRVRTVIDWLADTETVTPKPTPVSRKINNKKNDEYAKARVLEQGRKDGNEHLEGYNAKTGERLENNSGSRSAVSITPAMKVALADPANEIVIHHNHPGSSSFSPNDIIIGVNSPGAKGIWAHGHNGSSYYAGKGETPASDAMVQQVWQVAQQNIQRAIKEKYIKADDANVIFSHMVNSIYHARGNIKYEYSLHSDTQAAVDRNKQIFDHFVKAFSNV